jgi:uncharacterized C2H2 Zn-finger protein
MGARFTFAETSRHHQEVQTMGTNIYEFKCGQCGKIFVSLEDLQKHEQTTHGERDTEREGEPQQKEPARR